MFFRFQEKFIHRIKKKHLNLALTGEAIVILALGSILSLSLSTYSYYILILGSLISLHYIHKGLGLWFDNKKTDYKTHFYGYIGIYLILFLVGIQSPQMPFAWAILTLGIVLTIPSIKDVLQ